MDAADRTTALTEPSPSLDLVQGAIAQLVERVLCKHEVVGSIPSGSTTRQLTGLSIRVRPSLKGLD